MGMDINVHLTIVDLLFLIDSKKIWYSGDLKERLIELVADKCIKGEEFNELA